MEDCCHQEIIPIPGRKLSIHTNRHPSIDGTAWGWIDGCDKNICWANNHRFNYERATKFVKEYNQSLARELIGEDDE